MPVLHSKTLWNNAELLEADPLVQMARVGVSFNDRVELEYQKPERLRGFDAIQNQLFAYVPAADI